MKIEKYECDICGTDILETVSDVLEKGYIIIPQGYTRITSLKVEYHICSKECLLKFAKKAGHMRI